MQIKKSPVISKDVWITIKGIGLNYDDDDSDVELITEGKMFIDNGKYMVEYEESQMTGMCGTKTSMSIDGGILTVVRRGKINSDFIFTEGQRQDSMYETEYGNLHMSIFTNKVDIDFNDSGGKVNVEYQVDYKNDTGRNYINIFVKEVSN